MKAVIQRVTHASVEVEGEVVGRIDVGLLVLLGVAKGDSDADVHYIVEKIQTLRIFPDAQGKMNRAILDVDGSILLVAQFTLLGDTTKGRRPGFDQAAPPGEAKILYERVGGALRARGVSVQMGVFGADMKVELLNNGPVTFILDSAQKS